MSWNVFESVCKWAFILRCLLYNIMFQFASVFLCVKIVQQKICKPKVFDITSTKFQFEHGCCYLYLIVYKRNIRMYHKIGCTNIPCKILSISWITYKLIVRYCTFPCAQYVHWIEYPFQSIQRISAQFNLNYIRGLKFNIKIIFDTEW